MKISKALRLPTATTSHGFAALLPPLCSYQASLSCPVSQKPLANSILSSVNDPSSDPVGSLREGYAEVAKVFAKGCEGAAIVHNLEVRSLSKAKSLSEVVFAVMAGSLSLSRVLWWHWRGAHLPIHLNVVQSLVMSCFPSFLSCGRGRANLFCVFGQPSLLQS